MLPVVIYLIGIYFANNPSGQNSLILRRDSASFHIGAAFPQPPATQCWLALALAAWIAPRLVSFDLADNALPILLSHPISRFGYVLGKFIALSSSLSLGTWIPCLLLVCLSGICLAATMVRRQYAHCQSACLRVAPLDCVLSILGSGHFVLGEMESRGHRRYLRSGICSRRHRRNHYRHSAHPVGVPAESARRSCDNSGTGCLGCRNSCQGRLHLPTPAIADCAFTLRCGICVFMLNARIRGREVVRG